MQNKAQDLATVIADKLFGADDYVEDLHETVNELLNEADTPVEQDRFSDILTWVESMSTHLSEAMMLCDIIAEKIGGRYDD